MDVKLFDYHLPPKLIAQAPLARRTDSRLLVINRRSGDRKHRRFPDLLEYLKPGDGLVINNTKVFKARLWGRRRSGGKIEVFLVRPARKTKAANDLWEALVSPSRRLYEGEDILFDDSHAVTLAEHVDNGRWIIDFGSNRNRGAIVAKYGHVPLPPYVHHEDGALDRRRYQTVYADATREGAVAAPTAGLHFTRNLLDQIQKKGVEIIEVTLHVGPGTFKPIKSENIDDHRVDPEYADLSAHAADQINAVKKNGGAIYAVGTTSVRTLESAASQGKLIQSFSGLVDLYIRPGYRFRFVDHLVTNFHLPQSSLLVLVCAFAGRELVFDSYREAVAQQYRFYSYGDAMLIL